MRITAETQRPALERSEGTQSIAEDEKGGDIELYPSLLSLCDLRDSAVRVFTVPPEASRPAIERDNTP